MLTDLLEFIAFYQAVHFLYQLMSFAIAITQHMFVSSAQMLYLTSLDILHITFTNNINCLESRIEL